MTGRVPSYFLVTMLVWPVMLSGCGARQAYDKKYYVLNTTRQTRATEAETDLILEVRRFTIDSAFAGKGLVYRTGQFEYESDFYNEFLISPSTMITEKTRSWLSRSGVFKRVLDAASQVDPTHMIEGNITALYGDFSDTSARRATTEIRISLLRFQARKEPVAVFGRTYSSSVAIESDGPEGLIEALDCCLRNILSELEEDLTETVHSIGGRLLRQALRLPVNSLQSPESP